MGCVQFGECHGLGSEHGGIGINRARFDLVQLASVVEGHDTHDAKSQPSSRGRPITWRASGRRHLNHRFHALHPKWPYLFGSSDLGKYHRRDPSRQRPLVATAIDGRNRVGRGRGECGLFCGGTAWSPRHIWGVGRGRRRSGKVGSIKLSLPEHVDRSLQHRRGATWRSTSGPGIRFCRTIRLTTPNSCSMDGSRPSPPGDLRVRPQLT